ncbi:unnamed protein product [Schistosoma mattheei]|uniref:Uncharacterized protein n=1 Tax=Schistosoma mattheei TaxID=31246 RepID=A0A3P8DXB7_9TREM|nr:unnamed protein product [Schistosoma mattheei]
MVLAIEIVRQLGPPSSTKDTRLGLSGNCVQLCIGNTISSLLTSPLLILSVELGVSFFSVTHDIELSRIANNPVISNISSYDVTISLEF